MTNIPFLYTTLYAFKLLLTYENKREVEINDLYLYRESILDKVNEEYSLNEEDLEIEIIDQNEELSFLLHNYPDVFKREGSILTLNSSITVEQLDSVLKSIDIEHKTIFTAIYEINHTEDILNTLGIYQIFEFKEKVEKAGFELEKQIEEEYSKNQNPTKTKQLLYTRFMLLMNIFINNKAYIENYYTFIEDDDKILDEDFDYYEESRYCKNGEEYPIDNDLYKNSEFYEDIIENDDPIQQNIEDVYHYAIFGKSPLFKDKYQYNINQMYVRSSYSDIRKTSFSEIDDEEFAFYLVYVSKLTELIQNGATELNSVKNRLVYLLDDIKHNLYDSNNLNKLCNTALNMNITSDSFDGFEKEAKYYIKDFFEGNSTKKLEKIAFISTYYKLTKNKEIKEMLEDYASYPQYELVSKLIFGNELQISNKKRTTGVYKNEFNKKKDR